LLKLRHTPLNEAFRRTPPQQLGSIGLGCRLAAYFPGRIGRGQHCRCPLNADLSGGEMRSELILRLGCSLFLLAPLASAEDAGEQRRPDSVQSSLHFTRGTEALDSGDIDLAIKHLRSAVNLDPSLSRNHNNLAHAYFEASRFEDGWPHVLIAVNLDPGNEYAKKNFFRYFNTMKELTDLEAGDTFDQVRAKLGDPNGEKLDGEIVWWRYGHTALSFENGRLKGAASMGSR